MRVFCEFDWKSIDKDGKMLYYIIVKIPPGEVIPSDGFVANQNKEKTL